MLSLSENGCLIRSAESIPLGQTIQLSLDLPQTGAKPINVDQKPLTIAIDANTTVTPSVHYSYTVAGWNASRPASGKCARI